MHPPLQLDVVHPLEHAWKQAVPQPPTHEAQVQAPEALITPGTLASTIAPKIGSAPLAAFLKNSRRDWSSSVFLLLCIIVRYCAYRLPEIQRFTLQDVGVCTVLYTSFSSSVNARVRVQRMAWPSLCTLPKGRA